MSNSSFVPILPNELGGAIVANIFAVLSTFALVSIAIRAVWLLIRRHLSLTSPQKREHIFFFNTHFGRYGACLLLAMTLSSISGMIGIIWLAQRGITDGWVCRFQATLMQIATCAAAYFTVTIALHAFSSLVLRMRQSVMHRRSTMIIGWIIAIFVGLIPFMLHLPHGHVYGAEGLACAVRSVYPKTQFLLHLLPIVIGSFLSAILYSLTFLALRGTLRIRGGIKLTLNPEVRWNNHEEDCLLAPVARSMLWYPVAYIALLVPYSIVRLLDISGFAVSFKLIIFADVCWFSLGVVIVLLLYNTFHILDSVMFPSSAGTKKSMEFLSRHLKSSEYLSPPTPSASWNEKTTLCRNPDSLSSKLGLTETFYLPDPFPFQDQSLTTPLSSLASDYNHAITPPPSASLSSHSDIGRRDRKNAPLLTAGIPAPPGIYGNFVLDNAHVIIRQHSMQITGRRDPSRSRSTSW